MGKVALMTWSSYHNFGTSLQVTATTYLLKKLGYKVDVVNYVPHAKIVTLTDYKNIKYYINRINRKIKSRKNKFVFDEAREKAFVNFLNRNIRLTEKCKTDSELFLLNDEYDAFICGSDQIWAPSIFNAKYFLSFVENSQKMIAYAPSIGLSEIDDPYVQNLMKKNISRFTHLSVREEQGAKLIKEICNKDAKVVLDPTLLLIPDEWDTMVISSDQKEPYILCYFLGSNKDNWLHVYKLSKKTNISLKIIPIFEQDYGRGHEVVEGVGPGEFLSLVKNASLICTDSFHGTTFSIIYNRPFYVYERFSSKNANNQNSRIYNILNQIDLENRLIKDTNNIDDSPLVCDYTNSNRLLEQKRQESKCYLENALKEAINSNNIYDYTITNTCCGCGVCTFVCPTNAIEIKRDDKGFLRSFVEQEKCIRCKKCRTVCPYSYNKAPNIEKDIHNLYMLKSKDKDILSTSSSGGAGYEIAMLLSNEGYDVVGCTYDNVKKEAVHRLAQAGDIDFLNAFKGSKYIQSNTKKVFEDVIGKTNKAVIFGTPCQIAGVNLLLKSNNRRENYILVDLICYGVPSQHLWNKYLIEGSKRYDYSEKPNVEFRDKSKGWKDKFIRVEGNGKNYTKNEKKDLFYRFFLSRNCNMDACYECNFRTKSSADIRIGDYWGLRYKDDKEGVSMIIAMTKVGESILKKLKANNRVELEKKECIEYWTVQYPENPIKPVFHGNLIKELRDKDKTLKEIADFYCDGVELRNKIYSIVKKARKLVK